MKGAAVLLGFMQYTVLLQSVLNVQAASLDSANEVEEPCPAHVEECIQTEEEECGACHSIYIRQCNINMHYTYKPVKVRECAESKCGKLGYRRKCYTKYYTECGTRLVYREMEEDHPVCGVEKVERCNPDTGCKMVPVMRCKIEKKTIKKALPETSCNRIPSQICRKEKCSAARCFERVKMSREMTPKEECSYKEKRVCQETENNQCRLVKRLRCQPVPAGKQCARALADIRRQNEKDAAAAAAQSKRGNNSHHRGSVVASSGGGVGGGSAARGVLSP